MLDFLADREMQGKHAFVENGFESEVVDQSKIAGVLKPVLVGPDGRIVTPSGAPRGETLLRILAKHLGSTADPSTQSN